MVKKIMVKIRIKDEDEDMKGFFKIPNAPLTFINFN